MSLSASAIKRYMLNVKDYDLHSTATGAGGIEFTFTKDDLLCRVTSFNMFGFVYYTDRGIISLNSTLYSDIRRPDFDGLEKVFRFYVNSLKKGGNPW